LGRQITEGRGPLTWHDEVQSLGVQTSEKGGDITHEFVKCEVPKCLPPSHSQWSHQWRIGEGATVSRLYLEFRDLGESRKLTTDYPIQKVMKPLGD
jgi:hypothetical protein